MRLNGTLQYRFSIRVFGENRGILEKPTPGVDPPQVFENILVKLFAIMVLMIKKLVKGKVFVFISEARIPWALPMDEAQGNELAEGEA